jgi:hypothetical protein
VNEDDWVRQEIAHAIKLNKNIVPILLRDFEFPANLPSDIGMINTYNGVSFETMDFLDAKVDKLVSYLKKNDPAATISEMPKAELVTVNNKKSPNVTSSKKQKRENSLFEKMIFLFNERKTLRHSTVNSGVFVKYSGKSKYVIIPQGVSEINCSAFKRYMYDSYPIQLKYVKIPDSVCSIKGGNAMLDLDEVHFDGAFSDQRKLKNIVFPDRLKCIESRLLSNCVKLKSISFPTELLSIDESAFAYCSSLSDIEIPNNLIFLGEKVFLGCESLKEVNIPDGVTLINKETFNGCTSLIRVYGANHVTVIDSGAFHGCKSLIGINVSDKLERIEAYAFNGCSALEKFEMPNTVEYIGENAFMDCTSLKSIKLSDKLGKIAPAAFCRCNSFRNIYVPNGVEIIGNSAFSGCLSLCEISIPSSVKQLQDGVFYESGALVRINYSGTVEEWNNVEKGKEWNYGTPQYTVYCNDGIVKKSN